MTKFGHEIFRYSSKTKTDGSNAWSKVYASEVCASMTTTERMNKVWFERKY